MVEFSDFIEDMELIDPPPPQFRKGNYTQFKGEGNNAASRIDRFLVSKKLDDSFSKIKQTLLQSLVSDHNPVALKCGEWEQNKSYFKFDNWGLNIACFVDRIRGWWAGKADNLFGSLKEKKTEYKKGGLVNIRWILRSWSWKTCEIKVGCDTWEWVHRGGAVGDSQHQ